MPIEKDAGEPDVQEPAQQNMFEGSNGSNSGGASTKKARSAGTKGPRSLERLRDRVQLAIKEIKRLRKENAALQKQVKALQNQGPPKVDGTAVVFSEDPDALRAQIERYIKSIDEIVDGGSSSGNDG